MTDIDLELRGEKVAFFLLVLPAFLPSVLLLFLSKIRGPETRH